MAPRVDGPSYAPSLSSDGRYITFLSKAPNLVLDNPNGRGEDIFILNQESQHIERLDIRNGETFIDGAFRSPLDSYYSTLTDTASGRYVLFNTTASNLVPDDTKAEPDIFVYDRESGMTTRVSTPTSQVARRDPPNVSTSLSPDGQWIAQSVISFPRS